VVVSILVNTLYFSTGYSHNKNISYITTYFLNLLITTYYLLLGLFLVVFGCLSCNKEQLR